MLLYALALGLAAWASPIITTTPYGTGTVLTPFGEAPRFNLERMCQAQFVIVGTVTSATPFMKKMTNGGVVKGERLHSQLVLNVERSIRGQNPSQISLTVQGGRTPTLFVPTPDTQPQPSVGARFMVGFVRMKAAAGVWPKGQPIFYQTFWVDADVDLPSLTVFKTEFEAACNE